MSMIAIINTINKQSPTIEAVLACSEIEADRAVALRSFVSTWICARTSNATIIDSRANDISHSIGTYIVDTTLTSTTVSVICEKKSTRWTGPDMLKSSDLIAVFTVQDVAGPVLPDVIEELEAANVYNAELEDKFISELASYPSIVTSLKNAEDENATLRESLSETEGLLAKEKLQVTIMSDILDNYIQQIADLKNGLTTVHNTPPVKQITTHCASLDSVTAEVKSFDIGTLRSRADSKKAQELRRKGRELKRNSMEGLV